MPSGPTQGTAFLKAKALKDNHKITPELAAQIVKDYVLPMFESDQRKQMKSKHNKMASIGAGTGRKFGGKQDFEN